MSSVTQFVVERSSEFRNFDLNSQVRFYGVSVSMCVEGGLCEL